MCHFACSPAIFTEEKKKKGSISANEVNASSNPIPTSAKTSSIPIRSAMHYDKLLWWHSIKIESDELFTGYLNEIKLLSL